MSNDAPEAGMSNDAPVLEIAGLCKSYGSTPILHDISFTIRAGECVILLGPSGAGKTTLFRCLTRLVEPDGGAVRLSGRDLLTLHGRNLRTARREIGLIFQQYNLIRRATAIENVLAGRLSQTPTWRVLLRRFRYADRQLALAALDRVGLLERAYQRADSLSGGQQQRVAIARVLAQQSQLVLADEPIASLDPETAASILETLQAIAHEHKIAVLCSLHQVEIALRYADRIIGMRDGRVVADLPVSAFGEQEHAAIYRSAGPTDHEEPRPEERAALAGQPRLAQYNRE